MTQPISFVALAIAGLFLASCSTQTWVHPTKPRDAFAVDYNKCQGDVLRDPKLQQGLQLLILQATERCVQKLGWVVKEED